jgi:hypothetical protein
MNEGSMRPVLRGRQQGAENSKWRCQDRIVDGDSHEVRD